LKEVSSKLSEFNKKYLEKFEKLQNKVSPKDVTKSIEELNKKMKELHELQK